MDQIYKRSKKPSFVSQHGPNLFSNNSKHDSGEQNENTTNPKTHRSIKNRIRAINRLLAKPVRIH